MCFLVSYGCRHENLLFWFCDSETEAEVLDCERHGKWHLQKAARPKLSQIVPDSYYSEHQVRAPQVLERTAYFLKSIYATRAVLVKT